MFLTCQPFARFFVYYLSACHVGGRRDEGGEISHLLFAYDTLIFHEVSLKQLTYLCWILMWFEALSRLKIYLEKSKLIPMGRVTDAKLLANQVGCKVDNLLPTYLRLPLGASYKSKIVWDGVEERFRKSLALWKRQYISKCGRLTLIRSILMTLPFYLLFILPLPRKVRLRIDQIQINFL